MRLEKRYVRKDGAVVWVKFSMTVERDADGKPLYEIAVYDDITAQRDAEARLRESEARFRQTFELAASGICHVVDGRFVRVNRSLCEILGYREKELLGKHVKDVSHPEDRDVTDADRARIRSGELDQARFEKRYLRRDGSVVWCDLAIALVRDVFGMPLYEIAVFDDITERKQAEAALQRGARGAEALQRRAGAVRLRRLARPAGAAAHGGELHPAAGAALRRPSSTRTRASSCPTSSTARRACSS